MIARYHEQKNHHLLIESFIELENILKIKWFIINWKKYKASYQSIITKKLYKK